MSADLSVPRKPYLGGYRNTETGLIYYHAKTQTTQSVWRYKQIEKQHRTTQTVAWKNESQQTTRESSTQANCPLLFLYPQEELIIAPSDHYVFSEEIKKKQLDAVLLLQRHWRQWLSRKQLKGLSLAQGQRVQWDLKQETLLKEEEATWLKELQQRKEHPSSKDDFTLLFSGLQGWWEKEVETLKDTSSGPKLRASLWVLLQKEAEKIQDIEHIRQNVQKHQDLEKRNTFLSKAAAPKSWDAYKKPILVETASTQTARFLKDLYATLSQPKLHVEDRAAALRQLKESIKIYSSPITDTLTSLANRELDLLIRGTKEKNLVGLRLRIRNLVWQFVRQPAFNPEAQRLNKLDPKDGEVPKILVCSSCNQHYILPPNSLEEAATCSVKQERFTKCQSCKYLENEGWIRKDLEIYKRMLKLLHATEEKKGQTTGMIYLLRPNDICIMVERIWNSQSCISGLADLKDLEFVRWDTSKAWTPWNSILTTRVEARHHNDLEIDEKIYDEKFCQLVYSKHLEAKRYFSTIPRFLPYLKEKDN